MSRPRSPEDERQSEALRVRLRAGERAALSAVAEKAGVKPSRLVRAGVRRFIGAPDLFESDLAAFREATRQLAGVANNLNQAMKRIHSGELDAGFDAGLIERLSTRVERLEDGLLDYMKRSRWRWSPEVDDD